MDSQLDTFQQTLLHTYLAGTSPWRSYFRQERERVGLAPVMVLFYHRIADQGLTPWTLPNDDFLRHLDYLQSHFEIVSLEEAQSRVANRFNRCPCVSITFDDGYSENSERALPELFARELPFTYFVTTENLVNGKPFPHDEHLGLVAPPHRVDELRDLAAHPLMSIGGHTRSHCDIGQLRGAERLFDEVIAATNELQILVGKQVRYFAFPFGQKANLNDDAIHLCREHGLAGFCSAYGGYNLPGDDPYHIQRIHGDRELVRLKNWLTIDPRKLFGTTRYLPRYRPLPMSNERGAQ